MVDLVKIRKKAREQKEGQGASGAEAASPETPVSENEANEAPESNSKKPRRPKQKKRRKQKKQETAAAAELSAQAAEQPPGSSPEMDGKKTPSPDRSDREPRAAASSGTGEAGQENGESRLNRFKRTAGVVEQSEGAGEMVDAEAAEDFLEVLTFTLADEHYAIDVDRLVEIIVPRAATRVPNATEEVIGIISLRGSIVTLLDLRKLLGHERSGSETDDTRIVVIQYENERIGFIVDRVLRVVKMDPSSVEPHPVVSAAEQNESVHGVFMSGDAITIYIDLDRIAS
ncbi:MAG: chemotaxis protein CheW [Acidobacteria bacterium]|nr:chemotaxis protein CheW [Acidobacteriota bacterium]